MKLNSRILQFVRRIHHESEIAIVPVPPAIKVFRVAMDAHGQPVRNYNERRRIGRAVNELMAYSRKSSQTAS